MNAELPDNDVRVRVDRIYENAVGRDLSSWERHEFLPSVRNRVCLSDKQLAILARIERKVFDGEEK